MLESSGWSALAVRLWIMTGEKRGRTACDMGRVTSSCAFHVRGDTRIYLQVPCGYQAVFLGCPT